MLEDTLVVWCGEFGRTPDNGRRGGGERLGRDHNKNAMPIFLAGGGVNKGHTIGATDEIGETASEVVHPIRDFHITLLRLLGLTTTNSPTSTAAASSSLARPAAN